MARRMKPEIIALVVIGGVVGLYFVDRNVMKGQLKFAAIIDQFIGQFKKMLGQGAGPITAAPFGGGQQSAAPRDTAESEAEQLEMAEELGYESAGGP